MLPHSIVVAAKSRDILFINFHSICKHKRLDCVKPLSNNAIIKDKAALVSSVFAYLKNSAAGYNRRDCFYPLILRFARTNTEQERFYLT